MKRIVILILTVVAACCCAQNRNSELGPEDALKAFYSSICSGDFSSAEALCNAVSMSAYIDAFRTRWEMSEESIAAKTAEILSETTVDVTDVERNGQDRTIFYKLISADGRSKDKIATLKKEEGEWKIEQITDRN